MTNKTLIFIFFFACVGCHQKEPTVVIIGTPVPPTARELKSDRGINVYEITADSVCSSFDGTFFTEDDGTFFTEDVENFPDQLSVFLDDEMVSSGLIFRSSMTTIAMSEPTEEPPQLDGVSYCWPIRPTQFQHKLTVAVEDLDGNHFSAEYLLSYE